VALSLVYTTAFDHTLDHAMKHGDFALKLMRAWDDDEMRNRSGAAAIISKRGLKRPKLPVADEEGIEGDLGKGWYGLHWLMTGSCVMAPGPLGILMLGGELHKELMVCEERVFALRPWQLREAHEALSRIRDKEILDRYDPKAMREQRVPVYPKGYLARCLGVLRRDLERAVRDGVGWLCSYVE